MNKSIPVIIEKNGKKLAVLAFTDLDGTVNNEDVSEKDRLKTINPAREVIEALQNHGIPVGIVTARSFGETLLYKEALGTEGFTITEDGAVIILPRNIQEDIKDLSQKKHIVSHDQQTALILSKVELPIIKDFLRYVSEQLAKNNILYSLTTTCTSTPQVLKELVQYQTVDDALRAMDRLASAFVRNATKEQYKIISDNADSWNIRISGKPHHVHIFGKDADKGRAIQFINDNVSIFLPTSKNVDGILPIVFGNDYSDVKLFEEAHAMGGIGIIVKDSDGHYKIPDDYIASYVIKTKSAYGYGMKEALRTIFKELENGMTR